MVDSILAARQIKADLPTHLEMAMIERLCRDSMAPPSIYSSWYRTDLAASNRAQRNDVPRSTTC
jgi:hypothetical protein